jgi:hypothetical protein
MRLRSIPGVSVEKKSLFGTPQLASRSATIMKIAIFSYIVGRTTLSIFAPDWPVSENRGREESMIQVALSECRMIDSRMFREP